MTQNEPPDPTPRAVYAGSDGFVAFLKDNLEAIAVAVVMALVIKHFCVEAFKIPTESMNPTLLGERSNPRGEGDRILVDKLAYLVSAPNRWDVIVFRYPLDRSRNFIKRIAGLPGERLRISRDGDIWVRPTAQEEAGEDALRIPQKPRRVREQFYRAVYPPRPRKAERSGAELEHDPRDNLERYFRVDGGAPNAWRLERHGLFVFTGGERGSLRNAPAVREHSEAGSWALSGNSGDLVRDVRIQCAVRLNAPDVPTVFSLVWSPDEDYRAEVRLSTDATGCLAILNGREQRLDVALEPGALRDVELEYVDGVLRVHVDGDELAAMPDGRRFLETRESGEGQRLAIAAEGGSLYVENLRIDRDQRYQNTWSGNPRGDRQGVDVPADSYFMLGDNTRNSSDSRRWRITTVHLEGGRTIRYEYDALSYVDEEYSRKEVVDVDGIRRTWHEDEEDGERGSPTTAAPFVHRDLIVGRAFLVFWPCFPEFPGRLGLIH